MLAGHDGRVVPPPHESKLYSEFSHLYDKIFPRFFIDRITAVIRSLDIRPGAKVLEVGIGTGLSMSAYPDHCEVTGVDLAPEMLERARRRAAENGWSHFRLLSMDAMDLEFPDRSFDYVTAFHVISVVPDPNRMMREVQRVCRPGGRIAVINHFRSTKPIVGAAVGALDPLTRRLGWNASVRLGQAFDGVPVRIEKRFKTHPMSLFTVVTATNAADGGSGGGGSGREAAGGGSAGGGS